MHFLEIEIDKVPLLLNFDNVQSVEIVEDRILFHTSGKTYVKRMKSNSEAKQLVKFLSQHLVSKALPPGMP